MALLSILNNNLKTVSRNWIYFIVLIICPIVLIIISGIMLNSADFKNLNVGIVDQNPNYSLNKDSFKNIQEFPSLKNCIQSLSLSKVSICIHSYESKEKHNIDVYIDNRRKIVEYYSRQFILEEFSKEKLYFYEQSSKDIEEKLSVFSASIENSKIELYKAYNELEEQEKKLEEYQIKLRTAKQNFDNISTSLKEIQPEIRRLKDDLNSGSNSLSGNLTAIKERRSEIENNMGILRAFLYTRLNPTDYAYVVGILEESLDGLIQIEKSLETINETYSDPGFINAINNMDSAITQIDEMGQTLSELEIELQNEKENTKESKQKINQLIQNLNEGEMEIKEIQDKLENKNALINFIESFLYSDDPILVSFPLLVAIIITFTSIVLSNIFILKQAGQKSYFREALTPARDFSFFFAAYLTNLFFILIQVIALLLIGYVLFGASIFQNIWLTSLALFLSVSIFVCIGMIIGYLIKTSSLSMLLAIFSVILLFIFSDILAPVALTGYIVKFFVNLNPFVVLNTILFDVLLIKSDPKILMGGITKLSIIFAICFVVTYFSKKANKRKTLSSY